MGVQPINFVLESASPYSLCYSMQSFGAVTTILPSATLIADAKSAALTYPGFSGSPLLETLLTPVADTVEATHLLITGGTTPPGVALIHCWLNLIPLGDSQEWAIIGVRDGVSGLAELSVQSVDLGAAFLWIRRTHTYDQ